jgi:hypothetical protein
MEALIDRLRALDARVDTLHIHGPGEPLLWKPFNEAIRLFMGSRLFNQIELVTNGMALHAIAPDVWSYLSVFLSRYPGVNVDAALTRAYAGRITVLRRDIVYKVDRYPRAVVNDCACYGPCYYKGRILPHCGPPVFDAAKRVGMDPWGLTIDLQAWDPRATYSRVALPCGWCWANGTFSAAAVTPTETVLHRFR